MTHAPDTAAGEASLLREALGDSPDPRFADDLRDDLRSLAARAAGRLWWFDVPSPAGQLRFVHDGRRVHLATNDPASFETIALAKLGFVPMSRDDVAVRRKVEAVLSGASQPAGLFFLGGMPAFQRRVLEVTAAIPRGEARTYGWVAMRAGAPRGSRAAGTALAHNPVPFIVPCHRVLRSDWRLGEYSAAGGPATKERLLRSEGVDVDRLGALAATGVRLQGCRSTRIFCLPTCRTGRHMRPENVIPFTGERQARAAGYRPCLVCQPA